MTKREITTAVNFFIVGLASNDEETGEKRRLLPLLRRTHEDEGGPIEGMLVSVAVEKFQFRTAQCLRFCEGRIRRGEQRAVKGHHQLRRARGAHLPLTDERR